MVAAFVCGLLQQALEKIDHVRALAGDLLRRALYAEPPLPHIPLMEQLRELVPRYVFLFVALKIA